MTGAPRPHTSILDGREPSWRVVLVGRGPIEASLRRSQEIELFRCRVPELALGALAEARRDADSGVGPARTAVAICRDAVEVGELPALFRALAMIDASAPLVVVGGPSIAGAVSISESAGAEEFLASVGAEPLKADSPIASGGSPVVRDAANTQPDHEARCEAAASEQGMLRALLSGSDLLGPALNRLRAALGESIVDVRPATRDGAVAPVGEGEVAVAAEHRGRVFAWLVGPRDAKGAIENQARTLALWMAVGEQHAQLRSAAFTDPLTGAWNRRYLERFLDMALDRARRDRRGVTLLLFDIDNFKHYNDNYGHPAGDEILRETVRLLTSVIRPSDRVCRIGGDEFAVVFDDPAGPRRSDSQPPASIHDITRRFQRQITEHRFPKLGEQARAPLTISGGMVAFPWDASDAASLLERADRLILDSKTRGKNVICFGPGAQRALGCGAE